MMDRSWRLAAGLVIVGAAIFAAAQWPAFPYFLDSPYHMAVIRGFQDAGGPVTHAFWEAAPEGIRHLYPPLFHLLWLPARSLGMPLLVMAKLWSWAAFPFLLTLAWIVFSRISTARLACLVVLALAVPFNFFLGVVNYLPATLVLAAALGILLALAKKRWLAGGLLLGMAFWLHAGLPWLLVLTLLIFSFLEPGCRRTAWRVIAVGLLVASPWLIHEMRHLSTFHIHPRGEEHFIDTSPLLIGLGMAGLPLAWKRHPLVGRFFVALAVGFLPMLIHYRFRYFSAQGLFPWLLLAGVTLDWLAEKFRPHWLAAAMLAGLVLGAPGFFLSMENHPWKTDWVWADTTFSVLAGRPQTVPRITAQSLFKEQFTDELIGLIESNTIPEELIYCNLPYLGRMLTSLSGRAMTFNEPLRDLPEHPLAEVRKARLIVWVKNSSGGVSQEGTLRRVLTEIPLEPLQETKTAYLFLNPSAPARRQTARAVVPWWAADLLILLGVGLVVRDLRRNG